MIALLLFCLFTSLAICGLHGAGEQGFILWPLSKPFHLAKQHKVEVLNKALLEATGAPYLWFYDLLHYIGKPLITCSKCMASVWGTVSYLLYFGPNDPIQWLYCVFIISFLNGFLTALYYKL